MQGQLSEVIHSCTKHSSYCRAYNTYIYWIIPRIYVMAVLVEVNLDESHIHYTCVHEIIYMCVCIVVHPSVAIILWGYNHHVCERCA